MTYNDVQDMVYSGTGNISENPLFDGATMRLTEESRCIDAGNDDPVPVGVTLDLDGSARFVGSAVDLGAYEYQSDTHDFSPHSIRI